MGRYQEIERLLCIFKPKIIIDSSTGLPNGSALIIKSRKYNIDSITLQHGIVQVFYTPIISDYFLSWGESSNLVLNKFNFNNGRVIKIGSPKHDSFKIMECHNDLINHLVKTPKKILVFFSNGNDFERNGIAPKEAANWLIEIAKLYLNRLHVIIKLHPKEDGSLYPIDKNLIIINDDIDLLTLLNQSDIITSICSSVLSEAILLDKPIWQFYHNSWPLLADNYKYGLAQKITGLNMLKAEIDSFFSGSIKLNSNDKKEFVFSNHGTANKKVVNFIIDKIE